MKPLEIYLNRRADPVIVVTVISLLLIITIGMLRPPEGEESEVTRDEFWRLKIDQPPVYDMVVGGDSRVLCDISPKFMSTVIGYKIYNFGFNFTGYSREYLDALESKLAVQSQNKSIVLGITPRSLTPLNMKVSGYDEENNREPHEKFGQKYLSYYSSIFRPVMLSSIIWSFKGRTAAKNFYRDGLMSVEISPPDTSSELRTYNKIFLNNRVSKDYIITLLERVHGWKMNGIAVYAFRPPVAQNIFEAENSLSGFDQKAFVENFIKAGGQWLEVDAHDLAFADGSHITAKDVPKFSASLALEIRKTIK